MPPTSAAEVLLLPSNEKEKMDSQKEEVKPHDIDFEASNLSLKQDFLVGEVDRYDGIIVDPSSLPADVQSFVEAINISLALWKSQERKVVWLILPTANANLVYPAIEELCPLFHPMHHIKSVWRHLFSMIKDSELTENNYVQYLGSALKYKQIGNRHP
ncbi:hypothetical protein AXG93_809s1040 [Marchantia polymorpha subsp. ruderalis]|uniref:Pre-nudix hydrolase domain-containing protein n=1 Tax=Marchantia polymorpha subsp. ruderalis TaxID=1480154 RepID=A0A176WI68_MARPO|nr:hypothetical protein AXG93_809s1040 [Marchantia polymorpha subsp. ruderalis]